MNKFLKETKVDKGDISHAPNGDDSAAAMEDEIKAKEGVENLINDLKHHRE